MGPSDEDVNYAYTARNKSVSINGFWMDATEITNNEYRQFTNWVRDSIAAKLMGFRATKAAVVVDGADATPAAIAEMVAGLRLRHYRFDKYKSQKADDPQR